MDIVIRALVVFVVLWAITRAVGRTTLGELSAFDLLLYITMGDLAQQAVTQQDASITGAGLAIGTFALLTVALGWFQWRFPRTRTVMSGRALLVIRDGRPLEDVMRRQRLSFEDVLIAAREQGIRRTSDIEHAMLEADGKMSFFLREDDGSDDGSSDGAADKPEAG